MPGNTKQYRYWILTIPSKSWHAPIELQPPIQYIKGQLELGEGGYEHYQLVCCFTKQVSLSDCKRSFTNDAHAEPSRSSAANQYVCKDETSVPGSQFELGELPLKRNSKTDWEIILKKAKENKIDEIDADIVIHSYNNLKKIAFDYSRPEVRGVQEVKLYWGETNTGKTRRVYDEVSDRFYIKPSSTKWWTGYNGEEDVIIDEFDGQIGITHLLVWFDRYPASVETKNGHTYLRTRRFWVTSNKPIEEWYPYASDEQVKALRRRFTSVIHFLNPRSIFNK